MRLDTGKGLSELITSTFERPILMPHEYVQRYERWMRSAGRTPRTVRQRLRMAKKILAEWPDPDDASPTELTEWLGSLGMDEGRELSRWSRATYYGDARAFFRWLHEAELIVDDPTESKLVERPKAKAGVPKPLSGAEEDRALDAAHGNMRAWLLLALRAGLRASEVAEFRGENIAEDFIILRGKGEQEAAIPTHPELWELAQDYPRRGWWFRSPDHDGHVSGASVTILVGRHFRRPEVDIPKGSIHRARHSYATWLLREGANMREVQTLMRHRSPATTAIYTAVDEDRLRAAINRLGRRSA